MDAVEPGPSRRRPAFDQGCNVLSELKKIRQAGIKELRWAQSGYSQRPRRWNNLWRDPAAQVDPLDLPECVIRQNGGEVQWLVEGGRDAGGFKIIKRKSHVGP